MWDVEPLECQQRMLLILANEKHAKIISSRNILRWILLSSFVRHMWMGGYARQQLSEYETLLHPKKVGGEMGKRKEGNREIVKAPCWSVFPSVYYVYMCEHISIIPKCLRSGEHTQDDEGTCLFGFTSTFGLVPFPPFGLLRRVGVFIIYFWVIDSQAKCFVNPSTPNAVISGRISP